MPMVLDAYIPEGALAPEAEQKLLSRCTDLLLEHGAPTRPTRPCARSRGFMHRHEMYVAGAPAKEPHYRFVCQVPVREYDPDRRAAVTKAMTEALWRPRAAGT